MYTVKIKTPPPRPSPAEQVDCDSGWRIFAGVRDAKFAPCTPASCKKSCPVAISATTGQELFSILENRKSKIENRKSKIENRKSN